MIERVEVDDDPRVRVVRSCWCRWARYALWKNPGDLTGPQQVKLALIAAGNKLLHRAYELKEAFRRIIRFKGRHGSSHAHDPTHGCVTRATLTPSAHRHRGATWWRGRTGQTGRGAKPPDGGTAAATTAGPARLGSAPPGPPDRTAAAERNGQNHHNDCEPSGQRAPAPLYEFGVTARGAQPLDVVSRRSGPDVTEPSAIRLRSSRSPWVTRQAAEWRCARQYP